MKQAIKLFVLILLLLPMNALAANSPSLNKSYTTNIRQVNLAEIGVESSETTFPIYEVADGNTIFFHVYSLNSNAKSISEQLTSSSSSKVDLTGKTALLNQLLSNVNQINKTNSESILNITNSTELLNIVATQILVWEITDGTRTSFNTIENKSSPYYEMVSTNKINTTSSGLPSLYEVYLNIVQNVQQINSKKSDNSQSNPYKLYYNVSNNRYQNIITSMDYDTLKSNYDITNNTPIKLTNNSNGLLAYINNSDFFTDVKSISLNQKSGSTNNDLQNFYYFNSSTSTTETFVLATKADIVPTKLYFTCAQGDFKIINLEGSGGSILGSTYNIKDSNGNLVKLTNSEKNVFVYESDKNNGITDITYAGTNTYTISELPDGEYSIIQTSVPEGNSFSKNEEDRTSKIKIQDGNFYSYNKILKKYEINSMRLVKFINYTSKVYVTESANPGTASYTLTNSSGENVNLYYNNSKGIYQASDTGTTARSEFGLDAVKKHATIYGLPAGEYTVTSGQSGETRKFVIKNDGNLGDSVMVSFDNKVNEINFYKLDEDGKYLNGGLFSISEVKIDSEETIDVGMTKEATGNSYKISSDGQEYTFSVENGVVNITGAEASKTYRITEIAPPDGYEIFDSSISYVDVSFDENGYAKSTPYIINKKISVTADASSNSELIIAIRTGNKIIKYGLIVSIIIIITAILILIRKKLSKR